MLGNPFILAGHVPGRPLVNVAKPWRRIRARLWLAMHPDAAAELHVQAEVETRAHKSASKHTSVRDAAVEARLLALAEQRAQSEDVLRLHDLRRTVGSWLAMSGASLPLIGKVLNHSNVSTTQVYARLAEDAPRAALEGLAERMAALTTAAATGASGTGSRGRHG
jgi:integrase